MDRLGHESQKLVELELTTQSKNGVYAVGGSEVVAGDGGYEAEGVGEGVEFPGRFAGILGHNP